MSTAELLPGTLDVLILKAVSLGKLHGYGVLLRIEQISGGALLVQQGALYQAPRAAGASWSPRLRVGHLGEEPQSEILPPDRRRPRHDAAAQVRHQPAPNRDRSTPCRASSVESFVVRSARSCPS